MNSRSQAKYSIIAVFVGLSVGSLFFLPFNVNPLEAYRTMFQTAFLDTQGLGTTLTKSTPLIFVSLGTLVAWKSGFYYLGFQGTLYLGATGATIVALGSRDGHLLGNCPSILIFFIALITSFLFGGLWSFIVGLLKVKNGGNEVLLSLMFNYIAIYLVNYLVTRPLRATGSVPQTERFPSKVILPRLFGELNDLHLGFVVAIISASIVWWSFRFSKIGYEVTSLGLNEKASRFAGINSVKVTLLAAFTAGGLGGLAGWSQVLGVQYRLLDGLDQSTGFEGIVTSLLGSLNSIGAVFASILYGGLAYGSQVMQRRTGIPSSVASMIQGIIVFLVLITPFWKNYLKNNAAVLKYSQFFRREKTNE